eukprot:CAMPEP_0114492830 /NCGR_PEP_ID=MMETSP0109-20121206/3771_1 /TAXON_ID=29199 /ORGANISM="Chlorarachnion reptans, Strain CCCM449" /LENGTH=100 /DNA_ID=CAMNT_0001669713 /DNA_START=726 /DNA_END=1028 /DNA_ORIENTATION=+
MPCTALPPSSGIRPGQVPRFAADRTREGTCLATSSGSATALMLQGSLPLLLSYCSRWSQRVGPPRGGVAAEHAFSDDGVQARALHQSPESKSAIGTAEKC